MTMPRLEFWPSFAMTFLAMTLVMAALGIPMWICHRVGKVPAEDGTLVGAMAFAFVSISAVVYYFRHS